MTATVEKESGMLDVGTHCGFCRQLDFLPFHCAYCEGDFCSSHRTKESHHCRWLIENDGKATQAVAKKVIDNDGRYFQSLLPEKGYLRVQQADQDSKKATTRTKSKGNKTALEKLAKFFKRNESSKKYKSKSSKPNAYLELTNLKRIAKGDDKIPISNRVYIYCYHIGDNDSESKKNEIFINKIWPIGRALDYIAQRLNVVNNNVSMNATSSEKLYLYKKEATSGELISLEASSRVAVELKDLDTVYLVRGDDKI